VAESPESRAIAVIARSSESKNLVSHELTSVIFSSICS
jgi:hypothetical protein